VVERSTGVATVQCLLLFTLLSYVKANAMEDVNVMEVDYFSLDVEGNELDVLKTIPFDSVLILAHSSQKEMLEIALKSSSAIN
jgi:hypothetical protein